MKHSSVAITSVALLISCGLSAQQAPPSEDNLFPKYPVKVTFHGHPAAPVLTDPGAHFFRTRIREGAAQGPVFADHYGIAAWGCGGGCTQFAIINLITGEVYVFPYGIMSVREIGDRLSYRRDSRAVHIIGYLNEKNSADRWYLWDGKTLNLIQEKPAKLADDPDPQQ